MRKLSVKNLAMYSAVMLALQLLGQLIVFYMFWMSGVGWESTPRAGLVFSSFTSIVLCSLIWSALCQE